MVFIDGSNLYHVLGEVCGRHDLSFGRFAEKLVGDRSLVRTYYYNIRQDSERDPNVASEQGKFLQTMYDTPYLEVRMGVSKRHGETMVEKGVDVFMATDLVAFAFMDQYDTAVVVSGDGDFFPAIQTAKNQGKHVEVAAFDNNLSAEAANVADTVIKLNKTYFTGLWSDRRRAVATSPVRRTRTSRETASPAPVSSSAETASTGETTATGGRQRTADRRTTGRPTTERTSRRRTPTRRTATSETAETAVVARTEAASAPEPVAVNGSTTPEQSSGDGTPVRRTPARRRVGARSGSGDSDSNGNGNGAAGPRPPALRSRTTTSTPSSNGDGNGAGDEGSSS